MAGHRTGKRGVPGAERVTFTRWLDGRCRAAAESGQPIDRIRLVRTSSEDPEQFRASQITSFAAMERDGDPDVVSAQELGFDIVRRDVIGDAQRSSLGETVFTVQMWHAPGGVGRRQMGVVLHVGRTLFVYLLSSARADNLHAEEDDRRGNAATEVIAATTRAVFRAGRNVDPAFRPHVFAREHERVVRDEHHGASIKRTFVDCAVIAHVPHQIDMLDRAAAQSFSFGTLISAGAVEAAIRGMNRAEIVMCAGGAYYGDVRRVLFTHEPLVTVQTDPRSGVTVMLENRHRLQVATDVDKAKLILRELVDAILVSAGTPARKARPVDWNAVAEVAARHDLPSRLPYDLRRNIRIKDKEPAPRARSAKSMFSVAWIDGLQHGWFTTDAPVKTDVGDLDLASTAEPVMVEGRRFMRCRTELPLPGGGWGISEQEWGQVRDLCFPRRAAPRRRSGQLMPFAGLEVIGSVSHDAERQVRLDTNGRYMLLTRPCPADGAPARAWKEDGRVCHEATMTAAALHDSVAAAAEAALTALEDVAAEPIVLDPAPCAAETVPDARERDRLAKQVKDAEDLLDRKTAELDKLRLRAARGEVTDRDVERAERLVARYTGEADDAHEKLRQYDVTAARDQPSTPPTLVESEVEVRTATAEFVIGALYQCAGTAPAWLNQACGMLFGDWRLETVRVPGERSKVQWRCVMSLEVRGEDASLRLPLSGEVFSSMHRSKNNDVAAAGPEDWGWSFFYQGRSMAEIGRECGIDGGGKKNSYLYKSLSDWLGAAVPDPTLRNAALHCPISATRRVLWHMVTGDTGALAGIHPGYVEHVMEVYSTPAWSPKWSWCRDTHTDARRVADYLARARDGAAALDELAAKLMLDRAVLLSFARTNGKPTGGGERRTRANAVAYFGKTFARGPGKMAPADRKLFLRPCPHHDCPARMRGEQAYCSVLLQVPETEQAGAVMCPACLRQPDLAMATVRFPTDYRRPWSGRYGRDSRSSGARNQEGWTFLDPTRPDVGASPPLPDTGARPRADAAVRSDEAA